MTQAPDVAQELHSALERAVAFEAALWACFEGEDPPPLRATGRTELSLAALLLSREHAAILKEALANDAPSTAAALFRLQFEALLRAAWIQYSATDSHLSTLTQSIDEESEKQASRLPGVKDMLKSIVGSAPHGLVEPLVSLHGGIAGPLNSYVHTGLHPIRRRLMGFPNDLIWLLLTQSNRLVHHAYRLMAALYVSQPVMDRVVAVGHQFNDCVGYTQDTST